MSDKPIWVDVVKREVVTQEEVKTEKTVTTGQKSVTTRVVRITKQPYVFFSCGHMERGVNFDSRGKDRKKVQCWWCERIASRKELS